MPNRSLLNKVFASLLVTLAVLLPLAGPALADALLDSKFADAASHDFISYFGFARTKTTKEANGNTTHLYYSSSWTSSLLLTVAKDGRIVHMKLGVPRPLIDDEKVTTRGRDIVKSFVMASAIGGDLSTLKELADEIYVRGLDLQPIQTEQSKASNPGVPKLQAYKIGKGPLVNGDNAIFLAQLPKLSPTPSPLFLVISGKSDSLGRAYKNCRLAFINDNMKASKSAIPLLWSESWDEAYWQSINKHKITPQQKH